MASLRTSLGVLYSGYGELTDTRWWASRGEGGWVDGGGLESAVFDFLHAVGCRCWLLLLGWARFGMWICRWWELGRGGGARVLLFSVLSCLEVLGIETEMRVVGVWFAVDSMPARFIVRREAGGEGWMWGTGNGIGRDAHCQLWRTRLLII